MAQEQVTVSRDQLHQVLDALEMADKRDGAYSYRIEIDFLRAMLKAPAQKPSGHMYGLLDQDCSLTGVFIAVFGDNSHKLCQAAYIEGETSKDILPFWTTPQQMSMKS